MSDITVVLNGYKRPDNIDKQLAALKESTIQPDDIMLWYNGSEAPPNKKALQRTLSARSNTNWGVWARFFYAMNARTKYVCVFDDDTIPGTRWLENCLETMKTHRGLLGTIGLVYPEGAEGYYDGYQRFGWDANGNNEQVKQVDFVGHAWFFERAWLGALALEMPDFNKFALCGEDMHFSYGLQKYYGVNTYVPPHPVNDRTLWGSTQGGLGDDKVALWKQTHTSQRQDMDMYFRMLRSRGWKLTMENK